MTLALLGFRKRGNGIQPRFWSQAVISCLRPLCRFSSSFLRMYESIIMCFCLDHLFLSYVAYFCIGTFAWRSRPVGIALPNIHRFFWQTFCCRCTLPIAPNLSSQQSYGVEPPKLLSPLVSLCMDRETMRNALSHSSSSSSSPICATVTQSVVFLLSSILVPPQAGCGNVTFQRATSTVPTMSRSDIRHTI